MFDDVAREATAVTVGLHGLRNQLRARTAHQYRRHARHSGSNLGRPLPETVRVLVAASVAGCQVAPASTDVSTAATPQSSPMAMPRNSTGAPGFTSAWGVTRISKALFVRKLSGGVSSTSMPLTILTQ